ncbi:MAG: hypothetical protein K9L68_01175 [Spirochaetales bacterium]|nr:hypothetical protein [Spirochaetales bacterium]MCF7937188.1 hypothetical protein [Spirochaetales bacterium]
MKPNTFFSTIIPAALFVLIFPAVLDAQNGEENPSGPALAEKLSTEGFESKVAEVFREVDRRRFLPGFQQDRADRNIPLPLENDLIQGSPGLYARILTELEEEESRRVLIIGPGAEYFTELSSLLFETVHPRGDPSEELSQLIEDGVTFDAVVVHAGLRAVPHAFTKLAGNSGLLILPLESPEGFQLLTLFRMTAQTENDSADGEIFSIEVIGTCMLHSREPGELLRGK